MKDKRKIILTIIVILILCVGLSYAYFVATNQSNMQQGITGTLDLTYETKENIQEMNMIPTEESGAAKHIFTVNNTGTLDATYYLYMADIELKKNNESVTSSNLKWKLYSATQVDEEFQENQLLQSGDFGTITDTIELAKDISIVSGEKQHYILKIWLQETGKLQIEDQGMSFAMNVEATTEPKQVDKELVATDILKELKNTAPEEVKADDFGNTRYYGSDPNNYVTFNNEESAWRILGVMQVDGEERIKLVRNEPIWQLSWDTSAWRENGGNGYNNWATSDVMMMLNGGYEETSSLYWNRTSGMCYWGWSNANGECDFSDIGLTSEAKELLAETTYSLGALADGDLTAKEIYPQERGNTVYGTNPTSLVGYVGLMYPSDYGYATDENQCNQKLWNYNNTSCTENNYLFFGDDEWLITTSTSENNTVFYIKADGAVSWDEPAHENYVVRPVVYLKADVKLLSGDGKKTNPYIFGNG